MGQKDPPKMPTMNSKTIHRQLKIEHHERNQKPGMNWCVPEGKAVPAPLVIPVLIKTQHLH